MGSLSKPLPNAGLSPNSPETKALLAHTQDSVAAEQRALLRTPPSGAPDLSDPAIQAKRKSQMLDSLLKQGRQSSFLTGLDGSPNPPTLGTKSLLGQ